MANTVAGSTLENLENKDAEVPGPLRAEKTKSFRLDKMLRRLVPASSRLTYNPFFKVLVNSVDFLPRRAWKELAKIPPNHLRIRIGVGNRLFNNHIHYLTTAVDFWMHAFHARLCTLDSTIVDIGCGCGRAAHVLRDYRCKSERFSGRYIGIDIDQDVLDWCMKNFDRERFEFHRSGHSSVAYRAQGQENAYYTLPLGDDSADFVFSNSLFTHLLENEMVNYCQESFRVLKPGGYMAMHVFSIDHLPPSYGDRHTFKHRVANAHVESLSVPEAAVAYEEKFLFSVARDIGFRSYEIEAGPEEVQPMLLCRK
jgi:SAM-dependent methyltransferase